MVQCSRGDANVVFRHVNGEILHHYISARILRLAIPRRAVAMSVTRTPAAAATGIARWGMIAFSISVPISGPLIPMGWRWGVRAMRWQITTLKAACMQPIPVATTVSTVLHSACL